jgi:hypothetical protein
VQTYSDENEAARMQIERRWFALHRAAGELQEECQVLAGVMRATQDDWREARARLSELEAARDALGEELARLDSSHALPPLRPATALGSVA